MLNSRAMNGDDIDMDRLTPIEEIERQELEEFARTFDLSFRGLDVRQLRENIRRRENDENGKTPDYYKHMQANDNHLYDLPDNVSLFLNLRTLDLSNNRLKSLPEYLTRMPLVSFSAKNNLIEDENLPKSFAPWESTMRELHLGGNHLFEFPLQILQLKNLALLSLGSNHLTTVPRRINELAKLSTLCLGGNKIADLPTTVGDLEDLEVLIVSDNELESLPTSIANLKKLKTLQLHKNLLKTLPTEIITLRCLNELSLRDNPLVIRFINDMTHNPASLMELAGRCIKMNNIPYDKRILPGPLLYYLHSAHQCVNPKCKGVFFDSRIEHVKFVDFCGKYRVPLMQYLCSSKCVAENPRGALCPDENKIRRVLLG
ncbi:Leucine Rich Repeat [Nesidiocoris tenuis]|uniref:Leucine Rich Repeat n=1 Tax=Nesidiocoris tenuis TaxID=355587 RepID=A0ABN7ACD7_9HEMI|nr:Leucine Rich Repeat [Nesidiocoris tenuis]